MLVSRWSSAVKCLTLLNNNFTTNISEYLIICKGFTGERVNELGNIFYATIFSLDI